MRAAALTLTLALTLAPGCRITPGEIAVIQAENALLREQAQVLESRCEQRRELDVRPERPILVEP